MLDFKAKSWLESYLSLRQAHPLRPAAKAPLPNPLKKQAGERFRSFHHPLYQCMQQSGIAFGFPLAYPFADPRGLAQALPRADLAKLILLDTLLYAVCLHEGEPAGDAYVATVARFGRSLRRYYQQLHRSAHGQVQSFVEDILFQRVQYKKSYFDFRRSGVNSHLFWDIYGFQKYYQVAALAAPGQAWFTALIAEIKELKILTLKVMAAAIHADWALTRQERFLARHFKQSSRLFSPGERQLVRSLLRMGPTVRDIQIPSGLGWPERRFLLDVGLIGVFADADIDLLENSMLQELAFRLSLTDDDLISSKANLGLFLFQHGEQLRFYKARAAGAQLLWQAIAENMAKLGRAAKMEAVETRDMAVTFGRLLRRRIKPGSDTPLPDEVEIRAAMEQLKDLPRFLPFFSLMFMPVPGITELYIITALSLEKLSQGKISLLPSQLRRQHNSKEEEE